MKKKSILFVLMILSIGLFAQKYDRDYKYDLFSNLEIGAGGIYSHSLESKTNNIGAQFRMTKRLGTNWRLRGIASVNGFGKIEGFDRYAKGMIGLSADFLPFYLFIDEGAVFNPSEQSKFGLAIDGGAGLQFKLGNTARLFVEGGIDRVNNGNKWQSNTFGVAGLSFDLGITPNDETGVSIKKNQPVIINELREKNTKLEKDIKEVQSLNNQYAEAAQKAAVLLEQFNQLEKRLDECNKSKENCLPEMIVYFGYAEYDVPNEEFNNLLKYSRRMIESGKWYTIEGFSSNNGDDHKNQVLSENRARSVLWALSDLGVDESKMIVVGNGKTEKFGSHSNLNQCVVIKEMK